jgi:hypothetical protein
MGLGLTFLRELIDLKRTGALDRAARVVEIGAQQLADSLLEAPELSELYRLFDRKPAALGSPVGPENFTARAPSSRLLWTSLGFEYAAIDLAGDAIPLDLNSEPVPESMRGRFDLVINAGTTEHVANQDNAFRVIHDLAKVGAVIHHELPGGGLSLTHGFFSYTPKFFLWLADANGYDVLLFKVFSDGTSPVSKWVHNIVRDKGIGNQKLGDVQDITLRITLRKTRDRSFVTPLDVPGSRLSSLRENPLRAIRRRVKGW